MAMAQAVPFHANFIFGIVPETVKYRCLSCVAHSSHHFAECAAPYKVYTTVARSRGILHNNLSFGVDCVGRIVIIGLFF